MVSRDEDRFRVKPGAPTGGSGAGNGQRSQRFISQVLKQVSKAGASASGARGARPASTFGRGRVAADRAGHTLGVTDRRVVIKSRYVVLKKAGAKSVSTHLRYIERDGVTRDGQRGQAYGPETETADLKAFEERGKGDRHQFRFIVSVEDAGELEDLRGYTREFMQRMATDLETRLDWVAVDHWDTDNPHTHIVLRGRAREGRGKGQDLVIAPDYMAHGMRMRASELATEWLGPRTEQEIRHSLIREVDQERWTGLDRQLQQELRNGSIEVGRAPQDAKARHRRTLLIGRLQRLQVMGLAQEMSPARWTLNPVHESTLRTMGERGDIVRTMQRALNGQPRELAVLDARAGAAPLVGRIVGKGLSDELHERGYLVVDGIDGRAHYLRLPARAELASFPTGGIVEVRSGTEARQTDRTIVNLAGDGLYRADLHLARIRAASSVRDADAEVESHVRRLEALRRPGIVERLADDLWRIPSDMVEQGRQYDAQRTGGVAAELRSHLPIERQTRVIGATWLDQQLVGNGVGTMSDRGFGADVRVALKERVVFLAEQGLAERRGERVVLARNLLATLRGRDIETASQALQAETGLVHRPVTDGERVTGVYRRTVLLASGRFAMLDDGMGFSLVPWRPVVEQRLGQTVTALVRGSSASWEFGRQRGASIS